MSKAPKQYILPNNGSVGDKDSIAINGINSIAGNNGPSIYKNGFLVIDSIDPANGLSYTQYTHIDATEYLVASFFQADGITYLDKFNLNTGNTTGRIILAPIGIGSQDIVDNKSLLTYLGRINGNRYAITSYYDTSWKIALLNLEDMTIERLWNGNPEYFYDFTYDGINTIYLIYNGDNKIYYLNLSDALTQVISLVDDSNNPIEAKRIYGLTDTRLAIQLPNDFKLRVWNRSFQAGSFNTRETSTNVIPIPKQVNQTYYWLNSDDIGGVYLKGESGETITDLTAFLVQVGIINQGELGLYPLAITNYKEENGVITLNWILWRDTLKSFETLETIITPGSATTGQRYPHLTLSPTAEFMINNTNNTTNGYYLDRTGIAKFHNYALQLKWDNR